VRSSGGGAVAQNGGMSLTRGQLDKAVVELERSIKDTEKEVCVLLLGCTCRWVHCKEPLRELGSDLELKTCI
jgi:hypothetical protein